MKIEASHLRSHLLEVQDAICSRLESIDGTAAFSRQILEGERGGLARPRVLEGGATIEKAAVNFSHALGPSLPPAATERHPDTAGRPFEAVSVSLIVHPRNPYAPTTHANFRGFVVEETADAPARWWFGGGYDLTPYYGFEDDCRHWHQTAKDVCDAHEAGDYQAFKAWCDRYFLLHHRQEPRGIGGIFFDDLVEPNFEACLGFVKAAASSFLPAYVPILERRKDMSYGERERDFQSYRRGRYAEFNLVWDRGTRYGLQSGNRIESVLASLPPHVIWRHDWRPEPGTPEDALTRSFLPPRDWLSKDA